VRRDSLAYYTNIDTTMLTRASKLVSAVSSFPVQYNKAIVGRNAFAHESGIHQDGMLKNAGTYEIMTPESVGVSKTSLVMGKHSGRHALSLRCEQLGYRFERRELDEIYRKFVVLADEIKHVHDHHLLELIRETGAEGHRIPPGRVETPQSAAVAAGAEESRRMFPAGVPAEFSAASLPANPEHQPEQEDYLWGV